MTENLAVISTTAGEGREGGRGREKETLLTHTKAPEIVSVRSGDGLGNRGPVNFLPMAVDRNRSAIHSILCLVGAMLPTMHSE